MRYLEFSGICIAALMIAGCGKQGPTAAELDAFVQETSQNAVLGKLKDPKSAIFSEVAVHHTSGAVVACGKVNSRNSFGGMTGPQRFVSSGDSESSFLEEEMAPGAIDEVWRKFC